MAVLAMPPMASTARTISTSRTPESVAESSFCQVVHVTEDTIGTTGSEIFSIALIADPQDKPDRLAAARDTINSRIDAGDSIRMVILLGDISSTGDTSAGGEYDVRKAILQTMKALYVPIIGNHDMVNQYPLPVVYGPPPESLFVTRHFAQKFEDIYQSLADTSDKPGSPIHGWTKYTEHPWNCEIADWGIPGAHDVFQNFAFRAGPPESRCFGDTILNSPVARDTIRNAGSFGAERVHDPDWGQSGHVPVRPTRNTDD
jgi:hypothetical protein